MSNTLPYAAAGDGAESDELPAGQRVGDFFRITRLIGEGGMAQVYEAEDEMLRRPVAIKISRTEDRNDLILEEARALSRLQHPGLPVVHAAGEADGLHYVVLEKLSGATLEHTVSRATELGQALPLSNVVAILTAVAEALEVIHSAGLVHRDVKPANVVLHPKRGPVLLDLGLAITEHVVAAPKLSAGSPGYSAPEVINRDIRKGEGRLADLYSLGVSAYQLLTGDLPYDGDTVVEVLRQHVEEPVPEPRALRPNVPKALSSLVRELMAKRPGSRPQSAEEVIWRLRAIAKEVDSPTKRVRPAALVVDDDEDMSELLAAYLERWAPGTQVRVADSAAAALAEIEQAVPTLMIMDLSMPNMNGIEMLMEMRAKGIGEPDAIVAISGKASATDVELLEHLGVTCFLPKGDTLLMSLEPVVRNVLGAHTRRGAIDSQEPSSRV